MAPHGVSDGPYPKVHDNSTEVAKMFTPNSRPMCIIGSSCTITSERYPAQSVQGAPVCARLTGEMLMCSTTPANSTDSVDENARAERPSRCPPGGVMPRLSTAPRGARPEPHPRQHRGFLGRLGHEAAPCGSIFPGPSHPLPQRGDGAGGADNTHSQPRVRSVRRRTDHYVRCPGLWAEESRSGVQRSP